MHEDEYQFKRFEICSKANQWNDATKAVKLLTLLEGEALAIWLGLSEEEQDDFFVVKEKLINAMKLTALCCWESFTNESYTQVNHSLVSPLANGFGILMCAAIASASTSNHPLLPM